MNEPEAEAEVAEEVEAEETESEESDSEESEAESSEGDETEEGEGELQEEVVAIEFDGKTFEVPKDLESAFLMQKDYTQKTQSVAEEKKALEAREAEIKQQAEFQQENLEDLSVIEMYGKELDGMADIDWNAYYDQDFVEAQKAATHMTMLREQVSAAQARVGQRQAERSEQSQQELAKRVQETREYAMKEISGWNTEVDSKVTEFAVKRGFTNDELIHNMSPKNYQLLYDAYVGSQLQEKQRQVTSKAKPVTKVTKGRAQAAVRGPNDNISVNEWMKRRDKEASP